MNQTTNLQQQINIKHIEKQKFCKLYKRGNAWLTKVLKQQELRQELEEKTKYNPYSRYLTPTQVTIIYKYIDLPEINIDYDKI